MIDTETKLATLYRSKFGVSPSHVAKLKGDGSDRKIYRLTCDQSANVIGVLGKNVLENNAFISFSQHFFRNKLPVPRIHAYNSDLGIYLESDFGDTTLFDVVINPSETNSKQDVKALYKMVLEYLPVFQIKAGQSIDYSYCYQYPTFQKDSIQFDLNYFQNSFLSKFHTKRFDEKSLHEDFTTLTLKLLEADSNYFMYRDFQSKNVMIFNDQPYFIDYQSARKGALQYDLASLLYDANFILSNELRAELLEYYLDETSKYIKINSGQFKSHYYNFVLVRMLQALGAFSFLAHDKGKSYFLKKIPNGLRNIKDILSRDCILKELPELKKIFENDLFQSAKLMNL